MGPRMTYNQIWANTDQVAVTKNTRKCLIFLTSSSGMTYWQKPMIINRLKAADPTIVPGPRSPALKFLAQISMTDNMISGADEPSATKVRLSVPGHRGISSPSSQLMPEFSLAGTAGAAAASEPLAVANIQAATRQARPAWRTVAAIIIN